MFDSLQSAVLPAFLAMPGLAACGLGAAGLLLGPTHKDGRAADLGARLRETGLPVRDISPACDGLVRGLEAVWAVRGPDRVVVVCFFPFEEMAMAGGAWTAVRRDGDRAEVEVSSAGPRITDLLRRAAGVTAPIEVVMVTVEGAVVHAPDEERRRLLDPCEAHALLARLCPVGPELGDGEWQRIAGAGPRRLLKRALGGALRPRNWKALVTLGAGAGWLWMLAVGQPWTEGFWWRVGDPLLLLAERFGLM